MYNFTFIFSEDSINIFELNIKIIKESIKDIIDMINANSFHSIGSILILLNAIPPKIIPVNNGPNVFPAEAADKWTPKANAFFWGYL